MSNINSYKDILGFNTVYFVIRSINDTMYLVTTRSRCCQYEPEMSLTFDAKFHCHPTFWRIIECKGSFINSKSLVCHTHSETESESESQSESVTLTQ